MTDRNNELLQEMFTVTLEGLLAKIKSGDATASDLNVARQMLKDNGIEARPTGANPLSQLAGELDVDEFEDDDPEDKVVPIRA